MHTIRASALSLARSCPGAHRLAALHPRQTDATSEGTRKHEALRLVLSGVLEDRRSGPSWMRETAEWLRATWPRIGEAKGHPECFEVELRAELEGMELTGHADLLLPGEVYDWKTGAGAILPPILEDLQMLAYAVMVAAGSAPIIVHRVLVDQRTFESYLLDAEALAAGEAVLIEVMRAACVDDPPRTPGHHCSTCLTRRSCPEYLAAAEDLTCALAPIRGQGLSSPVQALRLLQAMGPVRDALEWADVALREFVRAHGPLELDGKAWGPKVYTQAKRITVPTEETIEVERWQWRKV